MLQRLKNQHRFHFTVLLFAMSAFSFGISLMRYWLTNTGYFLFLNWNLFLAFIPWLISSVMVLYEMNNKWMLGCLIGIWLLFFPNAPYILTDLFHLNNNARQAPIWFDLIVILSFAWTGLVFGFISLMDIERLLSRYFHPRTILIIISSTLFLASFGVYLGRFLRWNSWDIVNRPGDLLSDILDRFIDPTGHPRTWGMTILMGILLNMMYYSLKMFGRISRAALENREAAVTQPVL